MQTNQIIQSLIDNQIVSINLEKPFRYASGILSPIYTDFRLTISIPSLRDMIADGLAENIKKTIRMQRSLAELPQLEFPMPHGC